MEDAEEEAGLGGAPVPPALSLALPSLPRGGDDAAAPPAARFIFVFR